MLITIRNASFLDDSGAASLEPGGTFTMGRVLVFGYPSLSQSVFSSTGYLDNSLYTGDVDFVNIPSGQESYWTLPLTSLYLTSNVYINLLTNLNSSHCSGQLNNAPLGFCFLLCD